MCGLAGFLGVAPAPTAALEADLRAMADTMTARGPDGSGVWADAEAAVGLAHRRLSILDLSENGHQPMVSASGRFVIAYNGEIFNAPELAAELKGTAFRGHSDTEVILEACAAWGVRQAVERFIGMFAFALWDRAERRMVLVRDRLGIKPLYWSLDGGVLLFGSELKALRAHPSFRPEIAPEAVAAYMRHAYVPAPHTIYRSARKLPPGHILTIEDGRAELERYWDLRAIATRGLAAPHAGTPQEIADELDALLRDAVARRMVADVPLGAFLSGGVDSSTVVALMQGQSSRPIKTFSIGFREARFNEADHARAVARHLGTEHTELIVDPAQAMAVIPDLPRWYDEPFADSSQIPTCLVSRLARQQVTVALSGDGGDEGFAGYTRYQGVQRLWSAVQGVPAPVRRLGARALTSLSPALWDTLAQPLPSRWRPSHFGDKVHKGAALLAQPDPLAMYRSLVSQWADPETLVPGASEPTGILEDRSLEADFPDIVARLRYLDMMTYLPDDILTKVDRASMAASLEARVPLLDHRVIEFGWTLPTAMLIRDGKGKAPLRDVLYRYVPPHLIERPKMGFGVPIGDWLRGPLKDWAADLLAPSRLRQEGLLDAKTVWRRFEEHQSGRRNWQHALWTVLMFQSWRRTWG